MSSSEFLVDVAENWQSEFLQFFLFIFATIWLVQRGSPESKKPGDEGPGSDADQKVGRACRSRSPLWARVGGCRQTVYSNSLLLVMGTVFLLSWLAQSLGGPSSPMTRTPSTGSLPIDLGAVRRLADFWNRTLQNWQSEFLAVGTMVAFVDLSATAGSSESKPVGTPNQTTAVESE